jgi:hypothetical protein
VSLPKVLPKSEWVLTQAAFDGFLVTLDTDRDKAGEKYEYIRLKLLKYFQWCGSDVPDIDADETINRVTRRIYEGQDCLQPQWLYLWCRQAGPCRVYKAT